MTPPNATSLPTATSPASTSPLHLEVFTSPAPALRGGLGTFSPVTSTLILGERDAVLVDTQFTGAQVDAIGDLIEASGRTLRAIYITHGHVDHYFGLGRLLARFPDARPVATRAVAEHIAASRDAEVTASEPLFDDLALPGDSLPTGLEDDVLLLEGRELRAIDVGQSDISPSSVLHIPSLDAVIAGDVVYNGIHQFLALGGPEEWSAWVDSIGRIEQLKPKLIVAGHKQPDAPDDDVAGIIESSRDYIRNFAQAFAEAGSADEIVATMSQKHPERGNPTALMFSAMGAIARRDATAA